MWAIIQPGGPERCIISHLLVQDLRRNLRPFSSRNSISEQRTTNLCCRLMTATVILHISNRTLEPWPVHRHRRIGIHQLAAHALHLARRHRALVELEKQLLKRPVLSLPGPWAMPAACLASLLQTSAEGVLTEKCELP